MKINFTRHKIERELELDLSLLRKEISKDDSLLQSLAEHAARESLPRLSDFAKKKKFGTPEFITSLKESGRSGRYKITDKDIAIGKSYQDLFAEKKLSKEQLEAKATGWDYSVPFEDSEAWFSGLAHNRRVWKELHPEEDLLS